MQFIKGFRKFFESINENSEEIVKIKLRDDVVFDEEDIESSFNIDIFSNSYDIEYNIKEIFSDLIDNDSIDVNIDRGVSIKPTEIKSDYSIQLDDEFYSAYGIHITMGYGDLTYDTFYNYIKLLKQYALFIDADLYLYSYKDINCLSDEDVDIENMKNHLSSFFRYTGGGIYFNLVDKSVKYELDIENFILGIYDYFLKDDKGLYFTMSLYDYADRALKENYLESDYMIDTIEGWYSYSDIYDVDSFITYDLSDESAKLILKHLSKDNFNSFRDEEDVDDGISNDELMSENSYNILKYYLENRYDDELIDEFWAECIYNEATNYVYDVVYKNYVSEILNKIECEYSYDEESKIIKFYFDFDELYLSDFGWDIIDYYFDKLYSYPKINLEFDGYIDLDSNKVDEYVKHYFT